MNIIRVVRLTTFAFITGGGLSFQLFSESIGLILIAYGIILGVGSLGSR